MEETNLRNEIQEIKESLEVEKLVSKKIQDFILKKKLIIEDKNETREKLREKKLNLLGAAKDAIMT